MNTVLEFNKESFITHYLLPISKVADNITITPCPEGLQTVCSGQSGGSVVLFAQYYTEQNSSLLTSINIPDVKKIIRLLDCIENENITLEVYNNHLRYKDDSFKFNYFLLEDGAMPRCPISSEKIKKLNYNNSFTLETTKLQDVLKGSSIATESDKLYLFTKDKTVYAELNDFERQNINNICYSIANTFTGNELTTPIALGLESVRLLSGLRTPSFNVSINTDLKIVCFEYKDQKTNVKFILSGLVK